MKDSKHNIKSEPFISVRELEKMPVCYFRLSYSYTVCVRKIGCSHIQFEYKNKFFGDYDSAVTFAERIGSTARDVQIDCIYVPLNGGTLHCEPVYCIF